MSCLLNAGITRSCGFQFGGLRKVFLTNIEDISGVTVSNLDGTITGMTMTTGGTWYSFEYEPNTAQKLEELVKGAVSRFVNQTLNMNLANITQAKKNVLDGIAAGALITAIVQTQDSKYWLMGEPGKSQGLEVTVGSIDSGKAQSDDAMVSITMIGGNLGYANEVSASVVAGLV